MANGYTWNVRRDREVSRLPAPNHLGWWAAAAMFASIMLHIVIFFFLDRLKIAFNFQPPSELTTQPINIQPTVVRPYEDEQPLPPEDIVEPPVQSAQLIDDIELLDILPKNSEIDIKPEIIEAEYAIQLNNPALAGDPQAIALEISDNLEVETALPELGREPSQLRPAEMGQITVDPGAIQAEETDLGKKFTDQLIKQGANGLTEKGTLDGITSLDEMMNLPTNALVGKKTMLPSDLLFEFNSANLRESAKLGLMKLVRLMDRNPEMYCWIEGHADLVGGDEFNLSLSLKRAESVKNYLVKSAGVEADKIITRGFGRYKPIVITGTPVEQAANRRVEIQMRKQPPTDKEMLIVPKKAAVVKEASIPEPEIQDDPAPEEVAEVEEVAEIDEMDEIQEAPEAIEEPPAAPKAKPVKVKPKRAMPVEEDIPAPRAQPVEETEDDVPPLRAAPVEEEIPRAVPRAQAVE